MESEPIDWERLKQLRTRFLAGTAGSRDYWKDDALLGLYDRFFAERIGWKWDAVFKELKLRGFAGGSGRLIDWGCGTGVASRRFLQAFPQEGSDVFLFDRSPRAATFAASRLREDLGEDRAAGVEVLEEKAVGARIEGSTVLISHVLTELDAQALEGLLTMLSRAHAVLWVEPGTYSESHRLIALRERLRAAFHILGPCPHQEACGLLVPEVARHWCHSFAAAPGRVFTDPVWAAFSNNMGIDLRSLPYTYLALVRPTESPTVAAPVSKSCGEGVPARLLGRPRQERGGLTVLSCEASGVWEREARAREAKKLIKRLKKGKEGPFFTWDLKEGRIEGGQADEAP